MTPRMTVGQLKELLADYPDETEVRFAAQPNWPFEYSISADITDNGSGNENEDGEDEDQTDENGEPTIVWLAEGEQIGYLPGAVVTGLGWR